MSSWMSSWSINGVIVWPKKGCWCRTGTWTRAWKYFKILTQVEIWWYKIHGRNTAQSLAPSYAIILPACVCTHSTHTMVFFSYASVVSCFLKWENGGLWLCWVAGIHMRKLHPSAQPDQLYCQPPKIWSHTDSIDSPVYFHNFTIFKTTTKRSNSYITSSSCSTSYSTSTTSSTAASNCNISSSSSWANNQTAKWDYNKL